MKNLIKEVYLTTNKNEIDYILSMKSMNDENSLYIYEVEFKPSVKIDGMFSSKRINGETFEVTKTKRTVLIDGIEVFADNEVFSNRVYNMLNNILRSYISDSYKKLIEDGNKSNKTRNVIKAIINISSVKCDVELIIKEGDGFIELITFLYGKRYYIKRMDTDSDKNIKSLYNELSYALKM